MTENPRYELHNKLKTITPNVYYQPSDGSQLKYPCIVYSRQSINNTTANNNNLYVGTLNYDVTYMTRDGENTKIKDILKLFPRASLVSIMTTSGVYHEKYSLIHRL